MVLKCPKCLKKVSDVKIYSASVKKFFLARNWKRCNSCRGYVLTMDCVPRSEARRELAKSFEEQGVFCGLL